MFYTLRLSSKREKTGENAMQRWVRIPGPGEFRGEGIWRPLTEVGITDAEWEDLRDSGFLPVHEGDEPPLDSEKDLG